MRIRVHYAHTPYGLENPQKKNIKVILQINTQIEQIKTCVCLKKTFATYILFQRSSLKQCHTGLSPVSFHRLQVNLCLVKEGILTKPSGILTIFPDLIDLTFVTQV